MESAWPLSDDVAAESPEKPVSTRVDEVERKVGIQGLDFEEKLIVAVDELLILEQDSVGVNEHTPGPRTVLDIESKDQRELLIGCRVTSQVDIGLKMLCLRSVSPLRVIEVWVGGESGIKEEAVARVLR